MSEDRKGDMTETVWIVGRWLADESWQFQGVFFTKEEATAACRDKSYFIGSAILGKSVPHETREWPDSVYPLIGDDNYA